MPLLKITDIKQLLLLFIASVIVSLPYFLYRPKHGLMAVLLLMTFALLSRTVFVLIGLYSILINAYFLHLVPTWGNGSLVSRIEASFESANYERWEYLNTYFDISEILQITAYILSALFAVYWIFHSSKVSIFGRNLSVITSVSLIALSLLIYPTIETLKNFQLVHLPLSIYTTQKNLSIINKRKEYLATVKKTKIDCSNNVDKVIVILGESVNKNNMSIYGYHRKTTPFFDTLKPHSFNAISPGNQTRIAIPVVLTDATVKYYSKFYHSQSIVSNLSACGYTTYWISNQGKSGEHDTTITSIAKEADHPHFLNELDFSTAGLDENILNTLATIDTKSPKKQAFFFHLLGSHFSYEERYPEGKGYFKGDDVVTHYDNSIHYTDSLIAKIYNQFSEDNSLYIYLSDHGEIIPGGHGFSPSFKEEFEVPLLIWGKEQTKISHLLSKAKGKVINIESFNNIIKYLVGIDETPNVSFSTKVISLLPGNTVDYETLPKYSPQ